MTVLLAPGIICSFFFVYWIVRFPIEIWDTLMFRDEGLAGKLCAVITWVFFFGTVMTVTYLASLVQTH